jgi:hypothetical protein
MPKKCAPGMLCIENMTIVLLLIIIFMIAFFYYTIFVKTPKQSSDLFKESSAKYMPPIIQIGVDSRNQPPVNAIHNLLDPPENNSHIIQTQTRRAVPVNIETRGTNMDYTQVGILTRSQQHQTLNGKSDDLILPLMGRKQQTGRDKWQYYTMSTTGNMNTRLPISLNGKSCSGEYGCNDLYNGDKVYVEGYNDTFTVTLYENGTFRYIPYL